MNHSNPTLKKPENRSVNKTTNLAAITGWTAAIIFMIGIIWLLNQNHKLYKTIQVFETQNTLLVSEKTKLENKIAEIPNILDIIRTKEFRTITLMGNQAVSPQSFAKVHVNKKEKLGYIDAKGLPEPPEGKVFQLWTLKMEPFTSTNLGLLDQTTHSGKKFHKFDNFPNNHTLSITLENKGGSETPTLSEIYVMEIANEN